jgi:tRNA U38,U39,U40 pseudouridine synthase TruA
MAPEQVEGVLTKPGRALHGRAVPARGLTLERVIYESASNRTTITAASRRRRSNDRTGEQGT